MEDTKLFLITFSAAFLGVLPPGLVNMTVAKTCLEYGKKSGLFVAVGAAIVVLFQAAVAVFLARYIFDNPFIKNMLLRAGMVIFGILAIYFFIKARNGDTIKAKSTKANSNRIFKGMFIGVLNVFPIPYFIALAAAQKVGESGENHWIIMIIFSLAASLGTFASHYIYILFFTNIEDKSNRLTKYSNYFMAGLMLLLVVITVIRIFYISE